MIHLDELSKQV